MYYSKFAEIEKILVRLFSKDFFHQIMPITSLDFYESDSHYLYTVK
jgi:hypothetical protein